MELWEAVLLASGGVVAGMVNAVAGGGSMLTVPLLVLAGVPGNSANGSNRVGIVTSNVASVAQFRRLGVPGMARTGLILGPVVAGSLVGSFGVNELADDTFEAVFGLLMIPLIFLSLHHPPPRTDGRTWSQPVTIGVFFLVGLYGGAVQAGVGLVLLAALTRAGFDLVVANSVKVVIVLVVTVTALPAFILQGRIEWLPAITLAAGLTVGGWFGAWAAVHGGERLIRPVVVVAGFALALKLLGAFG